MTVGKSERVYVCVKKVPNLVTDFISDVQNRTAIKRLSIQKQKQEHQDCRGGKFGEYDTKMYLSSRSSIVLCNKMIVVIFVNNCNISFLKFNNDVSFTKYYGK